VVLFSEIPWNYTGIVEYFNGNKAWYLNGKYHRVDGPAFEYSSGTKSWYLYGKLHRVDGPAIELHNGDKSWCLNGKKYSQDEWFEMLSDEDKLEAIWNLR
jgi:hypothetical protein